MPENPEKKKTTAEFFYDRVKWTWITAADELSPCIIGMPNLCAKFSLVFFLSSCSFGKDRIYPNGKRKVVKMRKKRENVSLAQNDLHDDV